MPEGEINFETIIQEYLEAKRRKKQEYQNILYASELGYCKRKIWYRYKIPKDVSSDTLGIFEVGNLIHDKVTDILNETDFDALNIKSILSEENYPIIIHNPEDNELLRIGGRLDELVIFKNGEKLLIEKKSISKFDFLKEAKKEHLMQANLYMFACGAKKAQIVYFTKNDFKVKSFTVDFDQKIFDETVERAREINKALNENIPPEAEAKKSINTNWQCNYCDWKEECDEYERKRQNANI